MQNENVEVQVMLWYLAHCERLFHAVLRNSKGRSFEVEECNTIPQQK